MRVSITMGMAMLLLASGIVFLSWDKFSDDVKLMSEDDFENISTDEEYTPSENLAIMEGRFHHAINSIRRRNMLNG